MAKKRGIYLRKIATETWKETELRDVLLESGGGVVTVILAEMLGIANIEELWELIFLTVGGAICMVVISFIYRFLFIAPERLHLEMEKKIERAEARLKEKSIPTDPEEAAARKKTPWAVKLPVMGCAALCILLALQIANNHHLRRQVGKIAKQEPPAKPLPDKIVAAPTNAVSNQAPAAMSPEPQTNLLVMGETNKLSETFTPDQSDTNGYDWLVKQYALKKQQQAKDDAEAKAAAEENRKQIAQKMWDLCVPHYRRALIVLHDYLYQEAGKAGDGLLQSSNYFQCLPNSLDIDIGRSDLATIGFQKNTNVAFVVSLSELDFGNHRELFISCASGTVNMKGKGTVRLYCNLKVPDFNRYQETNYAGVDTAISASVKDLAMAQIYYSQTNWNKGVTNIVDNKQ